MILLATITVNVLEESTFPSETGARKHFLSPGIVRNILTVDPVEKVVIVEVLLSFPISTETVLSWRGSLKALIHQVVWNDRYF